jgi:hypothetical protein
MFTTVDTARIDTIFNFLPHTRQHGCIDILHCCNDSSLKERIIAAVVLPSATQRTATLRHTGHLTNII